MKLLSLTVIASLLTGALARSSVHIVSDNASELKTKPEISLNAFSMLYSHWVASTENTPVSRLQNNDAKQLEDIAAVLSQSNNLFEKKSDGSLVVVVSGVNHPEDIISKYDTSFYVASDETYKYTSIVEEAVLNKDVTLTLYKDQKTGIKNDDTLKELADNSQDAAKNFKSDFASFNTGLFDTENKVDNSFIKEVEMIKELSKTDFNSVSILEVNTLQALGQAYGLKSEKYKEAQLIMKDLFEKVVIPNFQLSYARGVSAFIVTPYANELVASGLAQGTCFASAKACRNGTSDCNGNGQCAAVKENCYVCQCKSSAFVGDACQYVNSVSEFQLLFWTSVLLIVITTSVVVCVYQSGSNADGGIILTQSLPKQD